MQKKRSSKATTNKSKGAPAAVEAETSEQKLSVPQRIAALMGTNVYTAGDLMAAVEKSGLRFKSGNLRSYISTTLNSADRNVAGPDKKPLKYPDGKLVKVHVFKSVARGQYRVATSQDHREEVKVLFERFENPESAAASKNSRQPAAPKVPKQPKAQPAGTESTAIATMLVQTFRLLVREAMREELKPILKAELGVLLRGGVEM